MSIISTSYWGTPHDYGKPHLDSDDHVQLQNLNSQGGQDEISQTYSHNFTHGK